MNLRDLEYLVALDKFRHFGKAAAGCFVSQPTLSGQIKKLEEELGVSLLERGGGRTVVFTEAGRQILARANVILQETQKIEEIAKARRDPFSGTLTLAAIPTVGPYILPSLLGALRDTFPNLRFVLHEMQTESIVDALLSGEIDLGLAALPLERDGLVELPLYDESFAVALPAGHPKARRKSVTEALLRDEKILLLEEGHCFRHQALAVCKTFGAVEDRVFRGTGLETLRYMVALGEGITLVPKLAEKRWRQTTENESIAFVPFQPPIPVRRVGLLFRSGTPRRECFVRVGEVIAATAAPHLQERPVAKTLIPVS